MAAPIEDQLKDIIRKIEELKSKGQGLGGESAEMQQSALKEMNKQLAEAKRLIDSTKGTHIIIEQKLLDQYAALKKNSNELNKIALINKGIAGTFTKMLKDQKTFLSSVDEWFKKSELLAAEYLTIAKNIGLGNETTRTLTDNFNNAVRESLKLGFSIEEMQETFSDFADETGRARILSDEEAENIAKLSRGAGIYASEATKLAEAMDLMGLSSEAVFGPGGIINQAIGSSREMGLNASKVIKVLQTNMKTMQNYSFVRGVKGMTEMAKVAVKMRGDVSEMLQMADKFYQPEAAIEAAANLQLLGGDIAAAFGDPFETMYLARNKPEELANRVAKMTENMMSFNEKTGEFEMPPEARMQLQAVSKELGLSEQSMITMARQASKIKNIKMDVSGDIADEDVRESIAGLARMKDGKWQVDFTDEAGIKQTKAIEELTNDQAKLLLDQQSDKKGKSEKDFLYEIAMNTQTFTKRMENFQKSVEFGFVGEADVYTATMDAFLKTTMGNMEGYTTEMFQTLNEAIGTLGGGDPGSGIKETIRQAFGVAGGTTEEQEGMFDEFISTNSVAIINGIKSGMKGGTFDVGTMMTEAGNLIIDPGAFLKSKDLSIVGNKTVVMGPAGAFELDPRDTYVGSDGGFVAGTDLYNDSVTNYGGGGASKVDVAPITVNGRIELVSPAGGTVNLDMDKIKATIQPIIIDALNQSSRNGGTLTGKETVDRGIDV